MAPISQLVYQFQLFQQDDLFPPFYYKGNNFVKYAFLCIIIGFKELF